MSTALFKAKRISRTSIIQLNGPLDKVFPLFGAIREKEWAEGWDPRMVYSTTQLLEEHMVFQTATEYPGEESNKTWVVSKYAPEQAYIEYTVFTSVRVYWVAIQCRENPGARTTQAEVVYTFTGLNAAGNFLIEKALNEMFIHDLKDWEKAINYYLETGKILIH
ncbi:MAG: hypothetical protein EHM45_02225 [Desulfobacteraceae bacterium]|nr:MAG: hypothetical protein EHM45_02225 [Desulfobacteraceae bacterium]